MKKAAANAALQFVKPDMIVGVGSGSTVNCFIEALGSMKNKSHAAEQRVLDQALGSSWAPSTHIRSPSGVRLPSMADRVLRSITRRPARASPPSIGRS